MSMTHLISILIGFHIAYTVLVYLIVDHLKFYQSYIIMI